MFTGKKYEDVIANVSISLKEKIEHSVSLLRKAEKLALIYDSTNGFMLAFSGGKDSQALFHIAELAGVKFKAHMNLTSVDPPEVIRFVKQCYPEVCLVKPYDSIFNIAVKQGILPTMRVRFCCAELKESMGAGKVTLIGIRHSESTRRSKRKEVEISDRKYSGTLEGLDEYRKEKLSRKCGRKPKNPNPKPEEFSINTADKESQAGCIRGKESLLISPIIDWEEKDVWEFLRIMEVPHCPLYDEGWKRLGCIGCPMSSAKQKAKENARWPHVRRNWIKAIIAIRRGVSQGERTNHKTNLGIWTGEFTPPIRTEGFLSHSGEGRTDVQNPRPMDARREKFLQSRKKGYADIYGDATEWTSTTGGGLSEAPILDMSLRKSGLPGAAIGGGQSAGSSRNCDPSSFGGGGTDNQLVSDGNPEQKGSAGSETLRTQAENAGTAVPRKRTDIPDWCTEEEWQIAETIYDWWISGKSYARWYSERFQQQKLDFGEDENET